MKTALFATTASLASLMAGATSLGALPESADRSLSSMSHNSLSQLDSSAPGHLDLEELAHLLA